jgi:lipopolysaccharide export LptBFGC system permease protein LptF
MLAGRVPGAIALSVETTDAIPSHRYVSFVFNDGRVTEFDPQHHGMMVTGVAPPVALDLSEDSKTIVDADRLPLLTIPAYARAATASHRREAWTEFYERLALGISPLFFALLAVPMALVARWKHTLTSFLPSLLVVMTIYYPLHIWGKVLGRSGSLDPMWGMFMGNAAVLAVSALAIVKVARR